MTEYPEGYVSSGIPQGSGEPIAEDTAGASMVLLGLAGAYHTAQTRLTLSTERAARDLWLRMRPVTDADLSRWMDAYDSLLAGASRTQAGLTQTYASTSLSGGFGARPGGIAVAVPEYAADRVEQWLESPQGRVASQRLRTEVASLPTREQWTVPDRALADRIVWMHSPVVKQRWHLSEGMTPDEAFDRVANALTAEVDAALRTVEADTVESIGWPTFKTTGAAMMYRRVPQTGACGWCRVVATRLYSVESFQRGRAWHVGCRCAWKLVTLKESQAYADWMKQRPGDYWGAAQANGYWSGEAPKVGDRFDAEAAAAAGYVSTSTGPRGPSPSSGSGTTRRASRPRASQAPLPGQVTQARLDSVRRQIDSLRQRDNDWSRQRLLELADELETLLRELGA